MPAGAELLLDRVEAGYGETRVIGGVSLRVGAGAFVGLIGPNACGKSTLLRAISRVLRPTAGRIVLDGRDLWRQWGPGEAARTIAVVPQEFPADFPFTVEETVALGRTPYVGRLRGEQPRDLARVHEAMRDTGTLRLAGRTLSELAGGERQRVILAKALAQEPRLLLLDEPTSHLDINHQVEILDLLLRLNRSRGMTVVTVLHDLNLAAIYCDHLFLLSAGRLAAEGRPEEVLTSENLHRVYGSRVLVGRHPVHACPTVTLLSQLRAPTATSREEGTAAARSAAAPDPDALGERARSSTVHVFGGGGSSAGLLESFVAAGYRVTAGPLNGGDSDWELARALGVDTITIPPFSPIDRESLSRAAVMMKEANAVVIGPIPFGRGNVTVLEAALAAARAGTPVALVDGEGESGPLTARDFTGGKAASLALVLLREGAVALPDDRATLEWLADATARAGRERGNSGRDQHAETVTGDHPGKGRARR